MRVLIISPYAPERCGIASYTVQLAASLRRDGHHVEVLSREPSAADHHLDLHTRAGMLAAAALSRRFDRTIVEFFPDLFFPTLSRSRFLPHYPWVALMLSLGRGVELVIHEAPYEALRRALGFRGRVARAMWRVLVRLPRRAFVHTTWERDQLVAATGVRPERVEILDHGQAFFKRTRMERAEARRELGLTEGTFHFLSIGFLQVHKGFDRAVRAMSRLPSKRVHLHVVGSMRVRAPEIEEYVGYLRELTDATPGVTLHEGYVTDELFDRWVLACDAVVLPYREIWSSGVAERAKLFGRPTIVTDVGGLRDQAVESTWLVKTDAELGEAMARLANVPIVEDVPPSADGAGPSGHDATVRLIQQRAYMLRQAHEPGSGLQPRTSHGSPSRVPPVSLRLPPSGGGLRSLAMRVVHRLTRWQLLPLVQQVNALRSHVAVLEEQFARQETRTAGSVSGLEADLAGLRHWLDGRSTEWTNELVRLGQLRSEDRRELSMALVRLRDSAAGTRAEAGGMTGGGPSQKASSGDGAIDLAALYEAHQDRFRGSSESIRERLQAYIPDVKAAAGDEHALVLDIGPGRGEWLELLRGHGINAYGVDLNERFVQLASERGLDVRLGDGVEHLRQVADGSLAAITAFHVVEHIPVVAMIDLVDQSLRALRPGGLLVLETPNPLNVPVGSGWFYLDWTHVRPIHPLFLQFVLETRGFTSVRTTAVHPPPYPPLEVPPAAGEALAQVADLINRHFFTGEDYVVIGRRSPAPAQPEPVASQAVRD